MSNKQECPACRAYNSSVFAAFWRGGPCPYCSLSAAAAAELLTARARGANAETVGRAGKAEARAEAAEREVRRLQGLLEQARTLLDEAETIGL